MRLLACVTLALFVSAFAFSQTYTIQTVAGTAAQPENVPGISVSLPDGIRGLATDSAGNLFVSLPNENVVLRLDVKTGILTRVAGNWTRGFSGDNGPAASAQLNAPKALAVDGSGNLYVSDNGRIRKVSTNGRISTIAGTAGPGCRAVNPVRPETRAAHSAIIVE